MSQELDAELISATKVYDNGVVAVDGVSFTVSRGEFFSLLGPSGCGKSTTLRLIAGLEQLSSGEIRIRGQNMGNRPAHRRPTNMVFQQLALFPHLDVAENVAFGLRLRRVPGAEIRRRVEAMLELVNLAGYERRRTTQLSGGQQQRVAIARALVNEPAVLLLDEPLGALDLKLRLQMQQALKDIQRRSRTTFIYVTHDQGEALTMSNRIAVMNDGRVEQLGPPDALYERPRTSFVAGFIGDTNLFPGHLNGDGLFHSGPLSFRVSGSGSAACVRPEKIRIGHGLTGANVFDGTLEETVYLGSVVRYRVRLSGGQTVTAQAQNDEQRFGGERGAAVQVAWDVPSMVLLES